MGKMISIALLATAISISGCMKCGMRFTPDQKVMVEDCENVILTTCNAVKFYQGDYNGAYPDSIETLERLEYLSIDPSSREPWIWTFSRSPKGDLLIRAESKPTSPLGAGVVLLYNYDEKKWLKKP